MTDHGTPDDTDDAIDSPGSDSPAVKPSATSPSVMAVAGAITGAVGVVLAVLPVLAMLWVWLAL